MAVSIRLGVRRGGTESAVAGVLPSVLRPPEKSRFSPQPSLQSIQ